MFKARHLMVLPVLPMFIGMFAFAATTTEADTAAAAVGGTIANVSACTCNTPGEVTTFGGLIDVTVANNQILNDSIDDNKFLNDIVVGKGVTIETLNNSLNATQVTLLKDVVNDSDFLSDNKLVIQDILNHNNILKSILVFSLIDITKVVAIDVLSDPTKIILKVLK
jgi:hypothetical protein